MSEKKYFTEKFGFIPNTPKKELIKHYAKIIAEKKLDKITINDNSAIFIQIPVWPKTYKGRSLKYFNSTSDGSWKFSFVSNLILKVEQKMDYHNIPFLDDFSNDDYEDSPNQFLVVASSVKTITEGTVAFLQPHAKINYIKYKGITLAVINPMSILFTEEV